jgi:glycosyltransferase involved in cell wall biosynthesis
MNAVYTGWLSQPQLHYLMSRTRLGFLSYTRSALQSLPNKVYEYMASGVAIVSSLEREAKCLIETRECGLSYRAEDLQSMTNSVMTLLDDDARCRRYGENGRRTFEREFRAEVVYSRMSGHLEKVAGFSANSAAHPDKTGDRECALGVLRS